MMRICRYCEVSATQHRCGNDVYSKNATTQLLCPTSGEMSVSGSTEYPLINSGPPMIAHFDLVLASLSLYRRQYACRHSSPSSCSNVGTLRKEATTGV
jgi:hypothetical protein